MLYFSIKIKIYFKEKSKSKLHKQQLIHRITFQKKEAPVTKAESQTSSEKAFKASARNISIKTSIFKSKLKIIQLK